MTNSQNLPQALFHSLRRNLFLNVVEDYSRAEPIRIKGWALLALGLMISKKVRNYKDLRIGVALPPGISGILGNLAVLFSGKISVNLNLTVSRESMTASLREAGIDVIISAAKVKKKFPDFPWTKDFLDIGEILETEKSKIFSLLLMMFQTLCFPQIVKRNFKLNQIKNNRKEAILLFTSGSSSQPKGVILSDQNILSNCDQMNSLGLFRKKMVMLGNLPLFHSFGLSVGTFFPLLHGLRIVSASSPLDYKSSLRAIREGRAEVILGTPTFLKGYLRKAKSEDFQSVRYVVAGAEKSAPNLIKVWEEEKGCEYLEGYGLTETSPGLSFNLPDSGKKEGSVGKLMKGIEGRAIDQDTGEVLKNFEPGILCFRGPNVFEGYLNNSQKTKEVFSEDGWFITGDLGRIDQDGFLFIEGRLSRFSKIGGEMVSHESVEDAVTQILRENGSKEDGLVCAVTGQTDEAKGESLILLINSEIDPKSLRELMRAKGVPNLWIPKQIRKVDKIPILGTGKLDLQKIKELSYG
ncbi:MAG: AMP-dependent synthetase [Verrucomicrobia bacterium]|nr:AMP-dependent synthetase [Verrucomicrobiota bacterium]